MLAAQSAFGLLVLLALAWLLRERAHRVIWRTVLAGLALQVVMALLLVWESRLAVESLETEAAAAEAAMPRAAALLD